MAVELKSKSTLAKAGTAVKAAFKGLAARIAENPAAADEERLANEIEKTEAQLAGAVQRTNEWSALIGEAKAFTKMEGPAVKALQEKIVSKKPLAEVVASIDVQEALTYLLAKDLGEYRHRRLDAMARGDIDAVGALRTRLNELKAELRALRMRLAEEATR